MKSLCSTFLFLFILISCQTEPEKIQTGWEYYNLSGKVKRLEKREGVVVEYKFGEPVFEQEASTIVDFNEFGFITKIQNTSSKKYDYIESERVMSYDNPKAGYRKKESFKGISYDGTNREYYFLNEYDTISKRITTRKSVDAITKEEEISVWEYKKKENRISKYNNDGELIQLEIENFSSQPQSNIFYDGKGDVSYEYYTFKNGNLLAKDSTVFYFSDDASAYANSYDKSERLINSKRYIFKIKDNSIEDAGETTYVYESSSKNSSYNLREYNDLNKTLKNEYRFQKNLDEMGNVIEEFKINMATNKIEEGISYTINYF